MVVPRNYDILLFSSISQVYVSQIELALSEPLSLWRVTIASSMPTDIVLLYLVRYIVEGLTGSRE